MLLLLIAFPVATLSVHLLLLLLLLFWCRWRPILSDCRFFHFTQMEEIALSSLCIEDETKVPLIVHITDYTPVS